MGLHMSHLHLVMLIDALLSCCPGSTSPPCPSTALTSPACTTPTVCPCHWTSSTWTRPSAAPSTGPSPPGTAGRREGLTQCCQGGGAGEDLGLVRQVDQEERTLQAVQVRSSWISGGGQEETDRLDPGHLQVEACDPVRAAGQVRLRGDPRPCLPGVSTRNATKSVRISD